MATEESRIVVKLEAEIKKLTTDLDKANRKITGFQKQSEKSARAVQGAFKKLGGGLTALLGTVAIGSFTRSVVQATQKQEAAIAQLEQGYRSTAGVVGQSVDEMIAKASELQNVTIFGDEQFIEAQSQLITFTNIVGREFDKTIELAADLSVRMGQDLKSSVLQLGKALNDPVANLGALSRSGIQFSKQQKDVIKQLTETGRITEAQGMILEELERQFGGSARAARDTFGGALQSVQNAFGDLLESKTGLNEAKNSLEQFTKLLQDPATVEAANTLTTALIKGFTGVAEAATTVVNATKFLADEAAVAFGGAGVAADDIVRLEEEATRLREMLDGGFFNRLTFFGRNGIIDVPDENEIRAELDKINTILDQYYNGDDTDNPEKTKSGNEKKPTKKPKKQLEILPPEINKQYESLISGLNQQLSLYGEVSKAAEIRYKIESGALGELTEKQKLNLITAAEELDQKNELAKISANVADLRIESLSDEQKAVDDLQAKYMQLAEAVQAGQISGEEASKIAANLAEQFDEMSSTAESNTSQISEFAAQAARSMQSTFADFLFDPFENGIKGMGEQFAMIIQRMIAEAASAQILNSLLGPGFTQTGQLGGMLGGFAGGFADGGTVPPNSWAIVGEDGPELAYTGSQPTHVVPNFDLAGGKSITVNMNVSGVKDAGDLNRTTAQAARKISRAIREAGG